MSKKIIFLLGAIVMSLANGSYGQENSTEVKIISPFNPKVIGMVPEGWRVVANNGKSQKQQVALRSGRLIEVEVAPFELVPESDSKEVFAIKDPGFLDSTNGDKKVTLEALLKEQSDALEMSEIELEKALGRLDALLKTLPLSEPLETQP